MKLYLKRRRNEDNRDELNSHHGPMIKEGPADGSTYHHEQDDEEEMDVEVDLDDSMEEIDSEYEVTDGSHS